MCPRNSCQVANAVRKSTKSSMMMRGNFFMGVSVADGSVTLPLCR
jgi:hypothetical protein